MSTHAMVAGVTWPKLGSNEQERTELVEILVFSLCFDYGPAVESHSLDCVADRPSCKTCSFQHSVLSHVSASQDPQQGPPARQWRLASHAKRETSYPVEVLHLRVVNRLINPSREFRAGLRRSGGEAVHRGPCTWSAWFQSNGRPFPGDRSVYPHHRVLHEAGFANQPGSQHRNDGLCLKDAWIPAAVGCVRSAKEPTTKRIESGCSFLEHELTLLPRTGAFVVRGKIALDNWLTIPCPRGPVALRAAIT
jgi:hypothetical protein